ncbi:ciliary microtubule inner protein 2B [Salminus brasiliensis]|uniref:ciliary microtubule inner protein 2B n=1 Tax=Salminus brasiliensis TaxID=930266 RepID=UPI003B8397A0
MEKFPPKFSKTLVTPDPHYIPGYAGYCPQLKYHLGKPYGQLTASLLTSTEVAHSQKLVLHSGRFHSTQTRDDTSRSLTGPNKQLDRIPGYTGFVPRSQNYFSKTYRETCREALHEFQSDQQRRMQLMSADLVPAVNYTLPVFKPQKLTTPLTAISKDAAPYKPKDPWKAHGSPYLMADNSPYKYFISGFTGYVPKARFLIGTGYPITTNKALIQFGKQVKAGDSAVGLMESDNNLPSASAIFPTHRGMLPSYTGHVPGYKFRYGQTFGQLTNNALALSSK